jgi:hypothetical protein
MGGVEGIVVGELFAGLDVAQRLELRPPVSLPRHARLDHHVRLAAVVHPAGLIDHVEEHAVFQDERPGVVAHLTTPPQHALDVGDDGALLEAPGRHHAEAIDGRAHHAQALESRHAHPSRGRFVAASSR